MSVRRDDTEYRATARTRHAFGRRNLLAGALLGIGTAGFLDETVFHQLLHWHHFYDRSIPDIGLVSDGVFHAVSWFAAIGAMFLLADLYRRRGVWWARWTAGLLLGAGAFQLYDGTVQHKLLGLHQIRYEVDLLPYDVVWNVIAGALILVGLLLLIRSNAAGHRTNGLESENDRVSG